MLIIFQQKQQNILKYLESKERVRAIDSELQLFKKINPEFLDSFLSCFRLSSIRTSTKRI